MKISVVAANASSAKRKRVSKNKKKNWRKFSDIKDVEEHLEEKRFEERTGGPIAEKPDEAIFFVDNEQDKPNAIKVVPQKKKPNPCLKNLNCWKNLEPSAFPLAIVNNPNRLRTIKTEWILQKTKKKMKAGGTNSLQRKASTPPESFVLTPNSDLWGKEVKEESIIDTASENYYKEQTKKMKIKVPAIRYKKPSDLPAVESPDPGSSYNPTYDDYQALLLKAHRIELAKKKEIDHLDRVLTKKFPTKAEAPTQVTWLQEMSQGLLFDDKAESSDDELLGNELECSSYNPAVRAEDRKPGAKKRRELKEKKLKDQIRKDKLERMRFNEVYRIRSIKSELNKTEVIVEEKKIKRKERAQQKRLTPGKISTHKYVAPDLEVTLSDDLAGSLREMKPEGNLLEDRLKSFQRRNMIEPRIRQKMHRKYKLKRYTKKSHKE